MDHKTYVGATAEARAVYEYTKAGWDVFTQTTGKSPFDLVVYQQGILRRIQVKGTTELASSGSYTAQLRSIRSNRNINVIKHLDTSMFEELAVYVVPMDTMFFFWPENVEGKSIITINPYQNVFRTSPGPADLD